MYIIRVAEPADYEMIAETVTRIKPEPVTGEEILKQDRRLLNDPAWAFRRMVAVRPEDGQVVGYCFAERGEWEPEGRCVVYAAVHPDFRGKGAGQSLLDAAESFARELGANRVRSWCSGEHDDAFAWAQRRGFKLTRQRTESVLDLKSFDMAPFAPAIDRVRANGLTLTLMDGATLPEELLRQVYELDCTTSPDVPVWQADDTVQSWEQYRKDWVEYPDPFVVALALDGDRLVGMSTLYFATIPGNSASIGYTAVLREYRGRGIAMAAKLLTMQEAMRQGVPSIRTNNDPDNPPMLAVNVKLGFKFIPGPRLMEKQI
jgi:GNAT superfamily N-acetyltransferase